MAAIGDVPIRKAIVVLIVKVIHAGFGEAISILEKYFQVIFEV